MPGAAVFLSILFGSLAGNIRDRALAAGLPADVIARFDSASSLDDTTIIATLPEAVRTAVLSGFADSMQIVFLVAAALLVPAFLLALRIEDVPLRTQGGIAAAQAEAAQAQAVRP